MRLIKILSLAAIAAVAAMALIGAGSASASVTKTVLCKVKQDLCAAGNLWGSDVTIKALSKLALLLGTLTVKCHSEVTILTGTSHSDRLLGTITLLDWTNCKGCNSATTTTLPSGSLFPTTTGNGELKTTSTTAVLLKECLGLECTALAATASLTFQGGAIGSTALSEANEVPTVNDGFLCGTGKWDAGPGESEPYVVTSVNGSTVGNIFISKQSHA